MAKLARKFDVLRGWPKEGAIDLVFKANAASITTPIKAGQLIQYDTAGGIGEIELATAVDIEAVGTKPIFLCVEGNEDFSGSFLDKVVALESNCVAVLESVHNYTFNAGMVPGAALTYAAGLWILASNVDHHVVGYVMENKHATNSTITVKFNGGQMVRYGAYPASP